MSKGGELIDRDERGQNSNRLNVIKLTVPDLGYFCKKKTLQLFSVICVAFCLSQPIWTSRAQTNLQIQNHCFDWNGDVATRVDCVPQRLNSLRKYLYEGMSDPGKIIGPGR